MTKPKVEYVNEARLLGAAASGDVSEADIPF